MADPGPNESVIAKALEDAGEFFADFPDHLFSGRALPLISTITVQRNVQVELGKILGDAGLVSRVEDATKRMPSILEATSGLRESGTVFDLPAFVREYVEVVTHHRAAIEELAGRLDVDLGGTLAAPIPAAADADVEDSLTLVVKGHSNALILFGRELDARAEES